MKLWRFCILSRLRRNMGLINAINLEELLRIFKQKNMTVLLQQDSFVLELGDSRAMVSALTSSLLLFSRSVTSNSLRPHGLQPTRLLCPWDSPGKNPRVGCHFLLQRILLTQGSKLCLLHSCKGDSLPLSHQGIPVFQ